MLNDPMNEERAKVEVDFMRITGGTGSGFIENTGRRPALKPVSEEGPA